MIVSAAVTKIGAQVDGGDVSRRGSVRFAGKALFLAADGEAGAHGGGHSGDPRQRQATLSSLPRSGGEGDHPQDGGGVGWAWRGCWVTLEGLFLPSAPLRQSFRLAPPHRCAAGRKMFQAILAATDKFSGLRGGGLGCMVVLDY